MNRPLKPDTHVLIEWGWIAAQFALPSLLRFNAVDRGIAYALGGVALANNALTDSKYALKRIIPPKLHAQLETPMIPLLLAAPALAGSFKRSGSREFFLPMAALGMANYFMTDFDAEPDGGDETLLESGGKALMRSISSAVMPK